MIAYFHRVDSIYCCTMSLVDKYNTATGRISIVAQSNIICFGTMARKRI